MEGGIGEVGVRRARSWHCMSLLRGMLFANGENMSKEFASH